MRFSYATYKVRTKSFGKVKVDIIHGGGFPGDQSDADMYEHFMEEIHRDIKKQGFLPVQLSKSPYVSHSISASEILVISTRVHDITEEEFDNLEETVQQ